MQQISFEEYGLAILDSSFYYEPISFHVLEELKNVKVIVSNTFDFEVQQYSEILPQKLKALYESNIRLVNETKKRYNISFNKLSPRNFSFLNDDIWGLINYVNNSGHKFVVITGNELLIQRIVLNKIHADIFDLNNNRVIRRESFDELENSFEFKNYEWSMQFDDPESLGEGSVMFTESGTSLVLGEEVASGSEAILYRVKNSPENIAKIFRKDRFSPDKYKNLKKILNIKMLNELDWALFPSDILYFDKSCSQPVGIIEKFAPKTQRLDNIPLYIGMVSGLSDSDKKTKVSDNIDLCIKVTRQILLLNSLGFFISDFNMGNFALNPQNRNNVQMWDTDSFGFSQYFSGYCSGVPTTREYDISKKVEAIDFCNESLYLFVFFILSLGDDPISQHSQGHFKYNNEGYRALSRKYFFPAKIWELFNEVFNQKRYPSVEILLRELVEAKAMFCKSRKTNITYKTLIKRIEKMNAPKSNTFKKIMKVVGISLLIFLIILFCCILGYYLGYYS